MPKITQVRLVKSSYHVSFDDGTSALYPRLTSVLDILNRPALMWWAANQEREMCRTAVVETYAQCKSLLLTPAVQPIDFLHEFDRVLGSQKAHQKQSQKAKDIGSETHALIQHDLKARLGKFDPEPAHSDASALAFMAWEDWRKDQDFVPVSAETPLASVTLESGGTNDAAGTCRPSSDSNFLVCDWKSSKRSKTSPNGIYFEAKVQVAVYRRMGIEMGLFPEDSMACVVRLPKSEDDPVIQEKLPVDWVLLTAEECDELARGFEHIRKTWAFLASNGAI